MRRRYPAFHTPSHLENTWHDRFQQSFNKRGAEVAMSNSDLYGKRDPEHYSHDPLYFAAERRRAKRRKEY
jgi:hypothetical protein